MFYADDVGLEQMLHSATSNSGFSVRYQAPVDIVPAKNHI